MKKTKYTYLKDYCVPDYLIPETFLEFDLYPECTIVKSSLKVSRNIDKITDLVLDGENLELLEVLINDCPAKYRLEEKKLIILKPPAVFILKIKVSICPKNNLTGLGLYLSNGIYCTQNEPHGFRTITYHLDRPDVLSKFNVLIHAPCEFTVIASNGNLKKHYASENRQHVWWEDPYPKSVYLFALIAGKLSTLTDVYCNSKGEEIILKIYAAQNKIESCKTALYFLKQAMRWDEEVFGLFYDLKLYQIAAIDDFNFGAMENKGLNIFNSKVLLLDPSIATDDDYRRVASTVAHEYFHNWTGNRVTLQNWFQIGLKEGLTTLREQLFMEDQYGNDYSRLESIQYLINHQFVEDSGSLAHPIQPKRYQSIDNFYTCTVYEKSSEIFRIIINHFGRNVFIKILKEFIKKFDGKYASLHDFFNVVSRITNRDFNNFFTTWFCQKGLVEVQINHKITALDQRFVLTQVHPKAKKNFEIFIDFFAINLTTNRVFKEKIFLNTKKKSIKFKNKEDLIWSSGLSYFSSPVKISLKQNSLWDILSEVSIDKLLDQVSTYNKWQIIQELIKNTIKNPDKFLKLLISVFSVLLNDASSSPLNFIFPSLKSLLLDTKEILTLEELYKNLRLVKLSIANYFIDLWPKLYNYFNVNVPYQFNKEAFVKRKMKNIILQFWLNSDLPPYELAIERVKHADNLTDCYGALYGLVNSDYPSIIELLDQLDWNKNQEIYNKWLSLNAILDHPCVLGRIKTIVSTSNMFRLTNPNNVYSLINLFGSQNLIRFHNKEAYSWYSNIILQIEKFNPNVAANLVQNLIFSQGISKEILIKQRDQLIFLQKHATSNNVLELVSKGIL